MEIVVLALSLIGLGLLFILMVYLAIDELKRQKQMSDDLHYIREVIENVAKENK